MVRVIERCGYALAALGVLDIVAADFLPVDGWLGLESLFTGTGAPSVLRIVRVEHDVTPQLALAGVGLLMAVAARCLRRYRR